ncbi:MAG: hypothetical protein AAF703_23070, partial [Cyanobacteria bacterium P01_D01_bin.105]
SAAQALGRTQLPTEQALETVPKIVVPVGHSVVLSFDNDQYIQSLWIDDPSILGVTTNRPLCGSQQRIGECGFATSIRLTQLAGHLDLPGTSFVRGEGRATLITVSTTGADGGGDQLYQFLLELSDAPTVEASLVSIVANEQIPAAAPQTPPTLAALQRSRQSAYDIAQVERGRDMAVVQGLANVDSQAWQDLEEFLRLTGNGVGVSAAMSQSGVLPILLKELERMGDTPQV